MKLFYATVSGAGQVYQTTDTSREGRDAWVGRMVTYLGSGGHNVVTVQMDEGI